MINIILSAIAGILFLCLLGYIQVRPKAGPGGGLPLLMLLIVAIEIASQTALHTSHESFSAQKAVMFLESMLPFSFILFSLVYSRNRTLRALSIYWKALILLTLMAPASLFIFPLENFFISPDFETEKILFLGKTGYWFYMAIMACCVMALVNLEATFSATSGTDRWRMKFELIGLSSIMAVFIFYFSQGLLYRTINMNLLPVRSAVLIVSALLIAYSRIFRGNGVRVMVSRYIMYRSVTVMIVGLYLLMLGLIGEGMRYFNVTFSKDIGILIAFITGMAVLLILFSEKLRRKVKVLISKHFYAHKHDYRTEWLKFTERLASCRTLTDVQDVILLAYKETFGLKGASLYLLDKNNGVYTAVARHDMPLEKSGLEQSSGIISYFIQRGRVFNQFDSEYEPGPEESLFISQTGSRLIVPLIDNDIVEGFIALGEQLAQEKIIYEDYDLMKNISKQALLSLMNFKLSEELAETREIAAVAKISSFVIHDLKNLTSSLSLLLQNADAYIGEAEFQKDMIDTVRNTAARMQTLIQRLKKIPEKHELHTEVADIEAIARDTVNEMRKMQREVDFNYKGSSAVSVADREEIRKVLLNLLLNAIDASNGGGIIRVETGMNGGLSFVTVEDNGCGMDEEFINNSLFRPFRTTKKKGLGIGLYQCKQIIEAHKGRIEVVSKPGVGTVFTVLLTACGDSVHAAK